MRWSQPAVLTLSPDLSSWLPLGFASWHPVAQGLTFILLTFITEDLTALLAAVLCAAGSVGWETGFWGCFLGIWLGDAGLYGLARGLGRPCMEKPWAQRWISAEKIRQSEAWFARNGLYVLVSCRLFAGMRLPLFLTMGFLRVPFGRFITITGITSALWTLAIFAAAWTWGSAFLEMMAQSRLALGVTLAIVLALFCLVRFRKPHLCDRNGQSAQP